MFVEADLEVFEARYDHVFCGHDPVRYLELPRGSVEPRSQELECNLQTLSRDLLATRDILRKLSSRWLRIKIPVQSQHFDLCRPFRSLDPPTRKQKLKECLFKNRKAVTL